MRSGDNWAGTNWHTHQSQEFHFNANRVSGTRKVKVSWWMTTNCNDKHASPTYYLAYKSQKLVVNGTTEISWKSDNNPHYTSNGHTVYRGFADKGSWLDNNYNKKIYHDLNGDYVGINRYIQVLGTKWTSGSFTKTADDAGNISFKVSGDFGWYGKTGLDFSKTFHVNGLVPDATYSVTYNANNSKFISGVTVSGMPTNQTKTYNVNLTLVNGEPVAKNSDGIVVYKFLKWNTKADGSGTTYSYKSSYTSNADLTLYAIWERTYNELKYDVTYAANTSNFVSGNTVSNMPTKQIKSYNKDLEISKTVPKSTDAKGNENYTFRYWVKDAESSFSGSNRYSSGITYTKNADLALKALWAKDSKTVTYELDGGTTSKSKTVSVSYGDSTTTYKISDISKYGCTLSTWKDDNNKITEPGKDYTCLGNITLTAQYTGNSYTISFAGKDNKLLNDKNNITATYGDVLTGDFSYSFPGYNLLGWNTVGTVILNPGENAPQITPNESYDTSNKYTSNYMYVGPNTYSLKKPFYVKNGVERKHMIGQNITLYPVLEYSTSIYIYTNGTWKLAMPYIYKNDIWKQSLGYINKGDTWKI